MPEIRSDNKFVIQITTAEAEEGKQDELLHHGALHRLHPAGCLSGSLPAGRSRRPPHAATSAARERSVGVGP